MMTTTSHHRRSIWVTASDKYVLSREDFEPTSRVWRSPEPTEEQQPVPSPLRLWPARRGAAFPEGESSIPYISTEDDLAIRTWFEQNLPPLLSEWTQPTDDENNEVTARWLEENIPEPLRDWPQPVPTTGVPDAQEPSRLQQPEPRGALPIFPSNDTTIRVSEPGENPFSLGLWPDDTDESESSTDSNPFPNPVHQQRDSDPFNARGGD